MLSLNKLSDDEQKLLSEIAKAKGKSLDEILSELGHGLSTPAAEENPKNDVVLDSNVESVENAATDKPITAETTSFPTGSEEAVAPDPPMAAEEVKEEAEPKLGTARNVCGHCGWDQANPLIEEPEHQDKLIFLQAIIGQKVFSKRYFVFDNNLRITFRSLTVKEIDFLYAEAFRAQKAGFIETASDYYEYLNRQRLFLQIVGLSANNAGLHITLPDGLSPETNSCATNFWNQFLIKEKLFNAEEPEQGLMQKIQDYILTNVLKTEHLQRVVNHTCLKFNKLVTKLEANVDNENFWKATEPLT